MLYPFPIGYDLGKIAPKAPNEQWRTQANAFLAGADAIEPKTPADFEAKARLYEWAAAAFMIASARTLGHKKSDRYEADARRAREAAATVYRTAIALWDYVKPNEEVERLFKEVDAR